MSAAISNRPIGPIGAAQQVEPSWDGQIVPALKKRLESESAYLEHRLSSTQFSDFQIPDTLASSSTSFPSGPSSPTLQPSHIPRARTKSTPLGPLGTNRIPSQSKQDSQPGDVARETVRSPSTTARKPSASRRDLVLSPSSVSNAVAPTSRHQSDSPADLQSRISSTSRSKTQHQAAKSSFSPDPAQTSMPSRTPILKGRSVSPGASPSLTINSSEGRDSPDLDQGVRIREGFIKNELPPFRMLPQEALRIAEQGHDIPEEDEAYHVDHSTDEEDEADVRVAEESGGREKRKRADTLRGDESPDKAAGRMNGAAIGLGMRPSTSTSSTAYTTLPRSSTSIGLGRPPSTRRIQGAGRSVSSKTAQSKTISSGAPRSASMNILASSSSRGVRSSRQDAGESGSPDMASDENYWQNVVVPNVVKRMAVSKEMGYLYCEGDLVLEKDKSGTPLKWIKQEDVQFSGLSSDDFANNRKFRYTLYPSSQNVPSLRGPDFPSPILDQEEPSPGPPLDVQNLRPKRSGESLHSNHPPPLRTTSAFPTTLPFPRSPAPFSSYGPEVSPGQGTRYPPSLTGPDLASSGRHPDGGDDAHLVGPRQASHATGEEGARVESGRAEQPQARSAGQGNMPPGKDRSGMKPGPNAPAPAPRTKDKGHRDEVSKGCGCIIM